MITNINFKYNWYHLMTIEDFSNIKVPDFISDSTIEREEVRIMKTISYDNYRARNLLTIGYKRDFIILIDNDDLVETDDYSIMIFDDVYYFGLKIQ